MPARSSAAASLSGVWPPNWTMAPRNRPRDASFARDLDDVLRGERLEVQAVGGVVVGGDGLRVAVHHDGLVPGLGQGVSRVHAAVVELDALADAVRAAAEDEDLLALAGIRLAGRGVLELVLVGGVEVRREGLEFRRAGVDALVDRMDRRLFAPRRHHRRIHAGQPGQPCIREAGTLEVERTRRGRGAGRACADLPPSPRDRRSAAGTSDPPGKRRGWHPRRARGARPGRYAGGCRARAGSGPRKPAPRRPSRPPEAPRESRSRRDPSGRSRASATPFAATP